MFEGFLGLTAQGYVHTAAASVGMLVGAEQVIRTRHDRLHRVLGYVYVGAMAITDVAALTVYRLNGGLTPFHVAAVVNFVFLLLALWPMLRKPRQPNWLVKHYMFICWSYVGLLAAAATEFSIRVRPVSDPKLGMILTIVATAVVTAIGAYLIHGRTPKQVLAVQRALRR